MNNLFTAIFMIIEVISLQCKTSLIGKWTLVSDTEKGTLEFKKGNTFEMKYFLENNFVDSAVVIGNYSCEKDSLLFLQVGDEPNQKYFIDKLNSKELIIRYKNYSSKYTK